MHVVQVRACAKPVHDCANLTFGLCDDSEPHVVFVGTHVVVRDGRDFIDCSRKFIDVGNLARTEARNKTELIVIKSFFMGMTPILFS